MPRARKGKQMPDDQIIFTEDMAALLGKSTDAVRAQFKRTPDALPPAFLMGRRICWLRKDVYAWVEERKATNAERIARENAVRDAINGLKDAS
jgi:predicted DNA-binding transcriptional regulator AlpA